MNKYEKGLSPAGNFRENICHSHISRKGSGGHKRWGNPIFRKQNFFKFFFQFSRRATNEIFCVPVFENLFGENGLTWGIHACSPYRTVPCGILDYVTDVLHCFANLLGAPENGQKADSRRIHFRRKRCVQQAIFQQKFVSAIISGKVQGVMGSGENPFSPHEFSYFIFSFFHFLRSSKFKNQISRL